MKIKCLLKHNWIVHQEYYEPLIPLGSYTDKVWYFSCALLAGAGLLLYIAALSQQASIARAGGVLFLVSFIIWFLPRLKRPFYDASCLRCKKHTFNFSKREASIKDVAHLKQELEIEFKEKRLEALENFIAK